MMGWMGGKDGHVEGMGFLVMVCSARMLPSGSNLRKFLASLARARSVFCQSVPERTFRITHVISSVWDCVWTGCARRMVLSQNFIDKWHCYNCTVMPRGRFQSMGVCFLFWKGFPMLTFRCVFYLYF